MFFIYLVWKQFDLLIINLFHRLFFHREALMSNNVWHRSEQIVPGAQSLEERPPVCKQPQQQQQQHPHRLINNTRDWSGSGSVWFAGFCRCADEESWWDDEPDELGVCHSREERSEFTYSEHVKSYIRQSYVCVTVNTGTGDVPILAVMHTCTWVAVAQSVGLWWSKEERCQFTSSRCPWARRQPSTISLHIKPYFR